MMNNGYATVYTNIKYYASISKKRNLFFKKNIKYSNK